VFKKILSPISLRTMLFNQKTLKNNIGWRGERRETKKKNAKSAHKNEKYTKNFVQDCSAADLGCFTHK